MTETIKIKIPKWAKKRRIYIFLGRECYAIREPDGSFWIKKVRCNKCGKCCMNIPKNWRLGTKKINGVLCCKYLFKRGNKWYCEAGDIAPFSCSVDNVKTLPHFDCVIKYKRRE